MRLHLENGNSSRMIAIEIDDPAATVRDLAHAVGWEPADPVFLDGRRLDPELPLADAELRAGSSLSQRSADPESDLIIGVDNGPDAGRWVSLGDAVTIGREADADLVVDNPTVSGRHASAGLEGHEVHLRDLDSHNGTWIGDASISDSLLGPGDRVRLGSSTLSVRRTDLGDRPAVVSGHVTGEGTILFNRPPRMDVVDVIEPVVVPSARPIRQRPALSIASLIVPVVFATVMVWATGRWFFALFALLSPMMALTNYVTQRRRVARQRAEDDETYEEGLVRLADDLDAAVAAEIERRLARAPGLLEVRRRAGLPSMRLWERRLDSPDALTFGLGRGDVVWDVPVERGRGDLDETIEGEIERRRLLSDAPLLADLRLGPLGITGDAQAARALARSALVQLAVSHGPGDVQVVVLTEADRVENWRWLEGLPHALTPAGATAVYAGEAAVAFCAAVVDRLSADSSSGSNGPVRCVPSLVLVVDDVALLRSRGSAVRELLASAPRGVHGIVLAPVEDQLPASVATLADVGEVGTMSTWMARAGRSTTTTGVADLVSSDVAADIARSLMGLADPDIAVAGGAVPRSVTPAELWGPSFVDPVDIATRWRQHTDDQRLLAELGVSESGVETVDLVADGPHGLVAGTTGAGKSEFLRTLVASLARTHSTDQLVFVLIDYKGGSAFDRCRDLPHVVGMVTDLDDHLAERALTSLEAELHHRERLLRSAQASDLLEYRAAGSPDGPLPRLVVVIDEFATLRTELPDFVHALIGIAQRGRSLGVHLVLATQRPSGAVDANIRANTNLRVALRVQDSGDSADVIDVKDAAAIGRDTPGRAYVRRGDRDLTLVQTAFVSGLVVDEVTDPVRVATLSIGDGAPPRFADRPGSRTAETDLATLVAAIRTAHGDRPEPRRPWLEDLDAFVDPSEVDGLASGDDAEVVLAIGDDPERQRRVTLGWSPTQGHLVALGVLGSGVSTTLRSLVHRLGSGVADRSVWVFAADHGTGDLAGLTNLPHVSGVLTAMEPERHDRLLTMLSDELDVRRGLSADAALRLPIWVVVIDGIAGFAEVAGVGVGGDRADVFERIVRDGPAVGLVVAAGGSRPQELPRALLAANRQHIVHELADPGDLHQLGLRLRAHPAYRPGRALMGTKPFVAQVVDWSSAVEPAGSAPVPPSVDVLADDVRIIDLTAAARADRELSVPVGLDGSTRRSATLEIRDGEHALIAGPARSGRTTTLRSIARQVRGADPATVIVGVAASDDAPLFADFDHADAAVVFDAGGTPDGLTEVLARAQVDDRRWLVLVDDADRFDLEDGPLVELARNGRPGVTVVAAARSTALRSNYGHWLRSVRASGIGILLQPDNAVDGDLLTVRLPRGERLPAVPGRGYLVHAGEPRIVQVAY